MLGLYIATERADNIRGVYERPTRRRTVKRVCGTRMRYSVMNCPPLATKYPRKYIGFPDKEGQGASTSVVLKSGSGNVCHESMGEGGEGLLKPAGNKLDGFHERVK